MFFRVLFFSWVFFLSPSLKAGLLVQGRVLNAANDKPLSGASVYVNSSTLGTVTDDSGRFNLYIPEPGYYELIASFVGFNPLAYPIKGTDGKALVTFKLNRKEEVMRSVVVMDKETRKKWMKLFMENFIGITLPASTCTLLNPDEVFFEAGERKEVLKAFSYVPLEIVNKTYGYKIYFQLEDFQIDRGRGQTYFYGYTRFEELKENASIPDRYLKNRQRYYEGSTLHFYHSLLEGRLSENKFNVFLKPSSQLPFMAVSDSLLLKTDSSSSTLERFLAWKDKLVIKYNMVPNGYGYLQRKVLLPLAGNSVQMSLTKLADTVYIDPNGSLKNPLEIQMGGYWEYEKLGNMLPVNYRPPAKKE